MPGLRIETSGIQLRWIGMWATRLSPERFAAKRRASVQLGGADGPGRLRSE
jgi:hypothetical protein